MGVLIPSVMALRETAMTAPLGQQGEPFAPLYTRGALRLAGKYPDTWMGFPHHLTTGLQRQRVLRTFYSTVIILYIFISRMSSFITLSF